VDLPTLARPTYDPTLEIVAGPSQHHLLLLDLLLGRHLLLAFAGVGPGEDSSLGEVKLNAGVCNASLGAVKSRACCGEWRRREEEGEGSEERHLDDYDLSSQ